MAAEPKERRIAAVVATYNSAAFIKETLTAILGQDRAPDEVIIVDDGSTDDTVQTVRKFDKSIRVIATPNGGPEVAKKIGIEASNSDWVALCDHDDRWHPDHLARLEALIVKYPEADFTFSNFEEFGDTARFKDKFASLKPSFWAGNPVDEDGFQYIGDDGFDRLLTDNPFFPSAGMFRKALYDEVGGIRPRFSFNVSGDIDMTRRFALKGNLAVDHHISVGIHKHGGNYSHDNVVAAYDRLMILLEHVEEGGIYAPHRSKIESAVLKAAEEAMVTAFYGRDLERFRAASRYMPFSQRSSGLRVRSVVAAIPGLLSVLFFVKDRLLAGKRQAGP